jgi:hypothetical protein
MAEVILPDPSTIRARIVACVQELRSLRKLLRASQDYYDAENARLARAPLTEAEIELANGRRGRGSRNG